MSERASRVADTNELICVEMLMILAIIATQAEVMESGSISCDKLFWKTQSELQTRVPEKRETLEIILGTSINEKRSSQLDGGMKVLSLSVVLPSPVLPWSGGTVTFSADVLLAYLH